MINFSADSSAIVLTDIHPVGLLQLKNSATNDSTANKWLSVTTSGKEIAGKVKIEDDRMLFLPAQPFKKGQQYLVSTPLNTSFGGAREILKGKINYRLKSQQKILTR
ncbi:hypothetical protein [Pedobacter sp.]|uniref:hypothetical protein n=1 Tax=Pedobacter sp. TaxID=1411316 RepID=UPI003D7F9AC1